MANAAHQLSEILQNLRIVAPGNPLDVIQAVADEYSMAPEGILIHTANLAHRTEEMYQELRRAGERVGHFEDAKASWMKAPFLYGVGWVKSGVTINPDAIIMPHDLDLLRAFAMHYDLASRVPKPNQAVLNSFILELEPIAEFIESLEISAEMKTLILTKIENVKVLVAEEGVGFDVILTKLGEILGLLVILAGSNVLDDEDAANLWDKVMHFTAKFGRDMTVNVLSGAIVSGGMGMLGI